MRHSLIGALLALIPAPAFAQAVSCTISSTSMDFGVYDTLSPASLDSTATITWSCSAVASVTIQLSKGSAATYTPRTLLQGTAAAAYNLYLDPARTAIWGDGTGGTQVYTASAAGPVNVSVFGRVPSQQPITAGAYSDSIVATILF
jgi:spore coat protein U-like protein